MKRFKLLAPVMALVVGLVGWALAQDQYDWMPDGGQALLMTTLDHCADCDDLKTLMQVDRSQEEWKTYFTERASTREDLSEEEQQKGALAGLEEPKINTLTTYLSFNFPIPDEDIPDELPEDATEVLPPDGRDLTIDYCGSCHSLAVPVNQDKEYVAWWNVVSGGSHQGIELNETELETLAHYLANNMPVPKDQLPEELEELPPGY